VKAGRASVYARRLHIVADDYGIGPETSRGIRELMHAGVVTATVLLVNSPHAEAAMRSWREESVPGDLGWHPCLTMDGPVARPERARSLLNPDGRFLSLGRLLTRLLTGGIRHSELVHELDCQYRRFIDLAGHVPRLVNGHHHIHIFPGCREALLEVLERHRVRPYMRRVREPISCLGAIPGARLKRLFLSVMGRWSIRQQQRAGLPGSDWLAGITDPPWPNDPLYFQRWLRRVPGNVVELMVHPGHHDDTLTGRDCLPGDGGQERRVAEMRLLSAPSFLEDCRAAGFIRP
jgi:chitin disaccharide deacetylase